MTTTFALGRQRAARFCVWLAVCAATASAAVAQTSTSRITQAVDDSSRVTLKNNVSSVIHSATDQGAAAGSTEMSHLQLVLEASDEQKTALSQYLAEVQQKSSSNYHKWLTPEQYGERFGASESDVATVTAWLEDQGFTDVSASKSRTTIGFSGTAETVQKAFGVSIHSFSRNGQTFYANTENPSIPSALSSVVSGVTHLSTLGAHSFLKSGTAGKFDTETKRLTPTSNDSSTSAQLHADLTYTSSSTNYLYLVPGDAATIYNTPNSFNANNSGSTSYTGTGVNIGIIGDAQISTTPVTNYRSLFLGDSTAPTITGTATSTSDADEAYLDLEISGGLAPGATIHYYTGNDNSLATQITNALSDNTVDILSVSFGLCEQYMTTSENSAYKGYWQQAAAQGIAVTVSSGDSGSAGCDSTSDSSGNTVTAASGGLAVNGLASSVYNIAVGGTDFQLTQSNYSTYASTSNVSSNYYRTALSYIPEKVWNDSTQSNTTVSANSPQTSSSSQNIVAASGGKSSCSTNATTSSTAGSCTSGYGKPSWQRGTGVPSDNVRDLPDVSLMSGVDYYSAWLVCSSTTSSGTTPNCSSSSGSFYFTGYGGTSAAAPAFAGILALVQQSQGGGRLGQAAANLYNIYNNSSSASSVFHDITVGNNSVPCSSGSTNCTKNSAGYYFESGYDTTTGYDLATGLGSVNATQLISAWSSGMGSATATVSASLSSSSIDSTNALTVTVNVSGSSNTPSGTVSVSGGGYTSSAVNLDAGTATIVIPASSLTVGTDTLTISYSGDGVYSSATTTASVTVASSGTLTATTTTLAASSTTPSYGASVTLTATVTPTAATGTVHFYDSSTLIGSSSLSSGTATLSTSTLAVGSHTLTATYAGNSTYASSSSSSTTVTVSSGSSSSSGTFTLGATAVTVSQGSSGTSTITVTPSNGYTGTVTIVPTASSATVNLCYTSATATVTGTSAVTGSLVIDTNLNDCSSSSATGGTVRHLFVGGKSQQFGMSKPFGLGGTGLALAGLFAGLLGLRQRRFRLFVSMLVLAGIGLAMTACGGSSSSSNNYTSKGTYTLTVTGTDTSNNTATTTFTLTVK